MQLQNKIILKENIIIVDRKKRIDIHNPNGESITLNDSAASLFRELMKGDTFEEAIIALTELYDVDKEIMINDLDEFVSALLSYAIIDLI